jgi:hypothetical protein
MSLKDQLEQLRQGQQHRDAEAERIKAMASTPIEQQLEQIPNLSVAQRAYLRERPYALDRMEVLGAAHYDAWQRGIPVDSPDYFHLMDAWLQQHGNIPFTTPPVATPAPAASPETRAPEPQTPAPMQHTAQPPLASSAASLREICL